MSSEEPVILRLGDFAQVKGGKRMPAGTALTSEKTSHPYLRIVDFKDGSIDPSGLQYVPKSVFPKISRYVISSDDLYISIVGTIGLVGSVPSFLSGANLTENAAKICNIDGTKINRRYLSYYLRSVEGQRAINALTVGSTQPKLALFRIEQIEIPAPSLEVQQGVADVLSALDDRITLLRETNATLEAIAQALFKSWFVDFDPVRAKMAGRAPEGMDEATAALFPDALEETAVGLVPKGWRVGRLDDLLVLQRGFDLPSQDRTEGDYPIIAASGPSGTHLEAMVKGPGVITGRSGVLGRVFLTFDDYWPLNTTLWIKEFRAATACYAYELLRMLDFKSFNAGSAVPTLNRNHIHGLPYVVTDRACVEAFDAIARPLHERVKSNERHALSLAALRDTLLPRLISGQLRLPELESALS